jgi:FAD binding domain/Aromatic-ring hydroxylase, C-terminal
VLVAGDAAHIQLPAGGPGMTTALQDVVNLGWKLAAQLRGWAPPDLLDSYHAERHPVGERMLSFTRAQGILLAPGEQVSALRDLMGELLTHQQTLRYVVDRLLGLDIRYDLDVQITAARSDEPLDGILVRPDGYVAWAAAPGERDLGGLRRALQAWFGVAG